MKNEWMNGSINKLINENEWINKKINNVLMKMNQQINK